VKVLRCRAVSPYPPDLRPFQGEVRGAEVGGPLGERPILLMGSTEGVELEPGLGVARSGVVNCIVAGKSAGNCATGREVGAAVSWGCEWGHKTTNGVHPWTRALPE
jgi:hypothetical protein